MKIKALFTEIEPVEPPPTPIIISDYEENRC